ncbi:MAG: amidohydrolase family protein [Phycisphaerae bacterium]|nr:amidohydrolase family protein [Phycisphaerae bacterium]
MIFDAHTHWDFQHERNEEGIRYAKSLGVEKIIAFGPGFGPNSHNSRQPNEDLATFAEKYPGFMYPVATVSPAMGAQAVEDLRWAITEKHMVGLKLAPGAQAFRLAGDDAMAVLEEAQSLGIPVFVCASTSSHSTPSSASLVARNLPRLKLVLTHAGSANYWADAIRAAKRCDNITLLSCGNPLAGMRRMVKELGAERVIFGSDFPCAYPHAINYELAKVNSLDISEAERERILCKNIAELINVEV